MGKPEVPDPPQVSITHYPGVRRHRQCAVITFVPGLFDHVHFEGKLYCPIVHLIKGNLPPVSSPQLKAGDFIFFLKSVG